MSIAEYDALPGTPDWATDTRSKSHIIVWYRYSRRIQAIPQDIQNRKMLRNRKGK